MLRRILLTLLEVCLLAFAAPGQMVNHFAFDPPVSTLNTPSVVLRVRIEGSPTRVAYAAVNAQGTVTGEQDLADNGVAPDTAVGDAEYAIRIPLAGVTSRLQADDVNRLFIGFLRLYNGTTQQSQLNLFLDVRDAAIPARAIARLADDAQATRFVVNINDSSGLAAFSDAAAFARFYQLYGDDFDFANIITLPPRPENRNHAATRNSVQGIGLAIFNNNASLNAPPRLQGVTHYPLPIFFDGADDTASHELGHQWINFLGINSVSGARPHWPLSSMAGGIMGFSLPGGAGGSFACTIDRPNGNLRLSPRTGPVVYKDLDLYLMGLMAPEEVGENYVLTDQNFTAALQQCTGANYSGGFSTLTVQDVIAAAGARLPAASWPQQFRMATLIISRDGLLSRDALELYDYFARRLENTAVSPIHQGFTKGNGSPFFVATAGRGSLDAHMLSSGTAVGFDTDKLDFGMQVAGRTGPWKTLTLTNLGTNAVTLGGFAVDGHFEADSDCATLTSDSSCNVSVRFLPGTTGLQTGSLTFLADGVEKSLPVVGEGIDLVLSLARPARPARAGNGSANQWIFAAASGALAVEVTCAVQQAAGRCFVQDRGDGTYRVGVDHGAQRLRMSGGKLVVTAHTALQTRTLTLPLP